MRKDIREALSQGNDPVQGSRIIQQRLLVRASLLAGVRDPRPPRPKGGRRA